MPRTWICGHCGQQCGDQAGGHATVTAAPGNPVPVCHPDDPARPDCYRRVTVYAEPLGALLAADPKPAGVTGITGGRDTLADLLRLGQELGPDVAVVCVTHKRFAPCRRQDGCVISGDPADVERVSVYQRGGS